VVALPYDNLGRPIPRPVRPLSIRPSPRPPSARTPAPCQPQRDAPSTNRLRSTPRGPRRLLPHALPDSGRHHAGCHRPSRLVQRAVPVAWIRRPPGPSPPLRNWVLDSGLKAAALFLRHIEVPPTSHEATSASLAVTPSILQEDAGWAAVAGLGFLGAMLGVVPRPWHDLPL